MSATRTPNAMANQGRPPERRGGGGGVYGRCGCCATVAIGGQKKARFVPTVVSPEGTHSISGCPVSYGKRRQRPPAHSPLSLLLFREESLPLRADKARQHGSSALATQSASLQRRIS